MICKLYDIKTYLEIGVYNGTSMSYVVAEESEKKCYGIDLFEDIVKTVRKDKQWFYNAEQGGKSNYYSTEEVTKNVESNNVNSKLSLIKGNSHNKKTINKLKKQLGTEKIDLLFIDGGHKYEDVKQDFENYAPLVKEGGIIVLDDYTDEWWGVKKYGDEIKINHEYDFIGVWNNNELILQKKDSHGN